MRLCERRLSERQYATVVEEYDNFAQRIFCNGRISLNCIHIQLGSHRIPLGRGNWKSEVTFLYPASNNLFRYPQHPPVTILAIRELLEDCHSYSLSSLILNNRRRTELWLSTISAAAMRIAAAIFSAMKTSLGPRSSIRFAIAR